MKTDFDLDLIKDIFRNAVELVYKNEYELIELKASERLIVHYLAIYFERILKERFGDLGILKVDVEYNRYGYLPGDSKDSGVTKKACTIDMVFHQRQKQRHNILCVEAKHHGKDGNEDKARVKALMEEVSDPKVPKYDYGIVVDFCNDNVSGEYFHGQESSRFQYEVDITNKKIGTLLVVKP